MSKFKRSSSGLLSLTLGLSGCTETAQIEMPKTEIPKIELSDLITNSEKYEGQLIKTKGYPRHIGDEVYSIQEPHKTNKETLNSLREVRFTTHGLHSSVNPKGNYFTITEIDGGLYLPTPEFPGIMYKEEIEVTGLIKRNEGSPHYRLQVNLAQKVTN